MQEQDEVIIKTVFTKGIISELLHKALMKVECYAEFQIYDLKIMNDGERMFMHIDMSANGNMEDLKKIFKGFTILKGLAKFCGNNHLYFIFEGIIKMAAKRNIDVHVNNLDIDDKNGALHICLNADGKMKNKDFKMILEKADFV